MKSLTCPNLCFRNFTTTPTCLARARDDLDHKIAPCSASLSRFMARRPAQIRCPTAWKAHQWNIDRHRRFLTIMIIINKALADNDEHGGEFWDCTRKGERFSPSLYDSHPDDITAGCRASAMQMRAYATKIILEAIGFVEIYAPTLLGFL